MATYPHTRPLPKAAADPRTVFADLRRRNAYVARVAQMLDARRERQINRVVQTQRKHQTHQAR